MASAPVVAAMHDRFPEAIEEEVELLDLDLAGYVLEWHARVPDWRDYYLSLDQNSALRLHEESLAGVDIPAWSADLDPQESAALRAARPADGDLPRRDSGLHASRSGRGDPVGDHDDGLLRPAAPNEHRRRAGCWTTGATACTDCSARACATASWYRANAASTSASTTSTATKCRCSNELYRAAESN